MRRRCPDLLPTAPALLAFVLVFSTGCAPTKIWRLDGDPPQAAALTTPYVDLHPAADGARRYVQACRTGHWEAAWAALSKQTRGALSARANAIGGHGLDLLRPLTAGADEGLKRLHIGDPLAHFALADARTYAVVDEPWPIDKPYDGRRLEARVHIEGVSTKRDIIVAFEDDGWRVHDPHLAAPSGQAGQ
jgi:hypothetical protein